MPLFLFSATVTGQIFQNGKLAEIWEWRGIVFFLGISPADFLNLTVKSVNSGESL